MQAGHVRNWRRMRQWCAAAGLACLALGLCAALKVRNDFDRLAPLPRIEGMPLSVVVLDREDRLLRAFTSADDKWRLPVGLDEIDPLYGRLLLAFEDKRFFEHQGVDPAALVRSAVQSLLAGRIVSGGSTLTMQVARLLDEQPTKSLSRKYRQVLKAVQLERAFSKDEILRIYALRAPFGGNVEGVRAASLTWFGKEPGRLTPAEAALLVALPQSPEARRPDRSPDAARRARNRVLARGAETGVLSREEARSASAEPVRATRHAMPLIAPHETRHARAAWPGRTRHGLTLDGDLQVAVEKLARQKIAAYPAPVSMAILVADHGSGEILASAGSPDLLDTARLGHVDMTRAIRSPGSTLKPFIYGLAFEERIGLPDSLISDRPTDIGGYRPANFDQAYQGTVTLSEALQLSLNTPAIQLLEAVGPARLIARLKRAEVMPVLQTGSAPGLAIGLGGLGMSLRDLAQAYAALARGGTAVRLHVCRLACERLPAGPSGAPVLGHDASLWVTDILRGLPQLQGPRSRSIAYKTGTAYGYRDAWAVGYDGKHVVAVWLGRPDGTPVPGQTGAGTAVPVLFDVFQKIGPARAPLPDPGPAATPDVPGPLRYARVANRPAGPVSAPDFRITFPPDGAELDMGLKSGTGDSSGGVPLVIKVSGGRRPYRFLVNDIPQTVGSFDTQLVWQPEAAGFTDVTVLDAGGAAARVTVEIR